MTDMNENNTMDTSAFRVGFEEMPTKKNSKFPIIPIVALVFVLAAGIGVFAAKDKLFNAVKEKTATPAEYYNSVEKDNFNDALESYMKTYNEVYEIYQSDSMGGDASVKVEISDDISTMLTSFVPQLSGLKSAQIDFSGGFGEKSFGFNLGAKINDADIISANGSASFTDDAISVSAQVPEISKQYLTFDSAFDAMDEAEKTQFISMFTSMSKMMKKVAPEPKAIEKWAKTYSGIVIDSIKTVEKTSGTITANGVEEKATLLNVSMSGTEAYDLLYALVAALEKDEAIINYVTDYLSVLKEMDPTAEIDFSAEDYKTALAEVKSALEESKEDITAKEQLFTMIVYVNGKGEIIGREITINEFEVDGEVITPIKIASKKATKGDDTGYEISVNYEDADVFTVKGNLNKGAGEFVINVPSEDISIKAVLSDCDFSKVLAGEYKCKLTLSTDYETLAAYELTMDINCKLLSSVFKVGVGGTDMDFGNISISSKFVKDYEIKIPSDAEYVDYMTGLQSIMTSFNPEEFVNDAASRAGLIITYNDLMGLIDSIGGASTEDYTDLEDDYDFGDDSEFDFGDDSEFDFGDDSEFDF